MHGSPLFVHMRKQDVLEAHGIRLKPDSWRKIERLAGHDDVDRTTWLREQIEALLSRVPDVHKTNQILTDAHERIEELADA